jgi:dihydroxyacetone kinase-like predicted kinase
VERLDVADMHDQEEQRSARLSGTGAAPAVEVTCGVVAVAAGDGMTELYRRMGAHVVDGGPTLNPSTFEILAGIHEVAAPEVIVLPNSGNVILAAERAAEMSEKDVAVVDSRWPQAGLACLLQHDPDTGIEENAHRMRAALTDITTGAVAPAARDDRKGRFTEGEAVGFVDEQIVVWGEPRATLLGVLERLADGRELITCVTGADAPLDHAAVAELEPAGAELELHAGGQPHYWWLLAAE